MYFLSILKRFSSLEFGDQIGDKDLFSKYKDCLEKINEDGSSILNSSSYFYQFLDLGIRSQVSNNSFLYVPVHAQLLFSIFYTFSDTVSIFLFFFVILSIGFQYMFCWILINADKQNLFIDKLFNWSSELIAHLELTNYLVLETGKLVKNSEPFNQDAYAKIWLKEMSSSMDTEWENIVIDLLANRECFVPKIRITLGGVRKSIHDASVYGFTDKNDPTIPNDLLKILILFSREKRILFFGNKQEQDQINQTIKRLVHHLELLFGVRDKPPIYFDEESEEWMSNIVINDRISSERNNLRQCIKIFNNIVSTYTGTSRRLRKNV